MSGPGRDIPRRDALKRMGGGFLGLSAGYALPAPVLESFLRRVRAQEYAWEFLRPGEVGTMTALADTVIPADERSGSASDAGTVEYVDFILSISDEEEQARWRDGLAWLDAEANRLTRELLGSLEPGPESGDAARATAEGADVTPAAEGGSEGGGPPAVGFAEATAGIRAQVLNQVAWPDGALPGLEERARWFTRVRDLVGSGFFSSRMGVEDIGYVGAMMRPRWDGAPREALAELGLSYEKWDARYGDLT